MPAETPLWSPSADRVAEARVTGFMRYVESQWQIDVGDYAALFAFSIERPDAFWRSVWDFCAVIGDAGERVVIDLDRMPGARFFPD
nr:acetoacetate--CoA ligase [Acidobacteriota bacterium]